MDLAKKNTDVPIPLMAAEVFDNYTVLVTLKSNHDFLQEHIINVAIIEGGKKKYGFECVNTGGFASLYVSNAMDKLKIVHGLGKGIVINKINGQSFEFNNGDEMKSVMDNKSGQFCFKYDKELDGSIYQYIINDK